MTDYTKLTDDDLDLEIARRLGWLAVRPGTFGGLFGYPPEPEKVAEHGRDWRVPSWSTDLNAAAELLKDMTDAILYHQADGWAVETFMGGASGANPAKVICLAWLEFTDSVNTALAVQATRS